MENGSVTGKKKGRKRRGRTPKGWFIPHVRNPEKYPDCRTDLIGCGGNTDVCPGRQTHSHRHCNRDIASALCGVSVYSSAFTSIINCCFDYMSNHICGH